jgi:hypothetical protein
MKCPERSALGVRIDMARYSASLLEKAYTSIAFPKSPRLATISIREISGLTATNEQPRKYCHFKNQNPLLLQ